MLLHILTINIVSGFGMFAAVTRINMSPVSLAPIPLRYPCYLEKENVSPAARAGYLQKRMKKGLPALNSISLPSQFSTQEFRIPASPVGHPTTPSPIQTLPPHSPAVRGYALDVFTSASDAVTIPVPLTHTAPGAAAAFTPASTAAPDAVATITPPALCALPVAEGKKPSSRAQAPRLKKADAAAPKSKTAAKSSKKMDATAKRTCLKATGAGSRSGQSNRRGGGTSDTEVMKLSEKQQQVAALKVPMLRLKGVQKEVESGSHVVDESGGGVDDKGGSEIRVEGDGECHAIELSDDNEDDGGHSGRGLSVAQKLKVVAYVTQPECWPSFKLNQHKVWTKIVDTILPGVTVDIIRNYWTLQAMPKYKAVREREKHMGGGDRDEPAQMSDSNKRKKTSYKFSAQVLDDFQDSKIFELINSVAHDDADIIHDEDESTPRKCLKPLGLECSSSNELFDSHHRLLSDAVEAMKQKARNSEHEEEEQQERRELMTRQLECESKKLEHESQTMEMESWKMVMQMMSHADARIVVKGEEMRNRLLSQ
ncbi:hypothetical protein BDQ17DRAFT_1330805 [Cyathus striatus]|nr:hypothetical protein BDQ17DRAFT_1330805 [Cyathus striatus]